MNVFSTIFGSSDKQDNANGKINWIPLTDISQLNEIISSSNEKPAMIFKHSTRCIVSRTVLKQFEKDFESQELVDTYFLDLLEHRDISNEIASRFGVYHQSPQLLLIKDGKSVYDVSHDAIDAGSLKGKL